VAGLKTQGGVAFGAGDFPAAIAHYTAALRLAPAHVAVRSNRAIAYLSAGDPQRGLEDTEVLLLAHAIAPLAGDLLNKVRLRKATALRQLGRLEEAMDLLEDLRTQVLPLTVLPLRLCLCLQAVLAAVVLVPGKNATSWWAC
jgi:tetratricopeptide (TPR) repeat protein